MARTSISYVKTRFETGDRPSQEDYVDLIDTVAGQATDLGTSGNNENTITEPRISDRTRDQNWFSAKSHTVGRTSFSEYLAA